MVRLKPIYSFLFGSIYGACPSGYTPSIDGASCLRLGTRITTWLNAEQDCKDLGGHLVSVGSQERNDEVKYVIP